MSKQKKQSVELPLNQLDAATGKWMIWLPAVVAFFLYANTITHRFVLDDTPVLEKNSYVQQGISGIPELLTNFYWSGYWDNNTGLYRPVSQVMFAIEHQLNPDSATLHHFMNVLLYALCCALLFRVLKLLFKDTPPWILLTATLLFVVHPMHTEVVANIKSRDEIAAWLFFLAACYYLFRNETRTGRDLLLGGIMLVLALLSKEGVMALIPLLLMVEWWRHQSIPRTAKALWPILVLTLGWYAWHHYVVAKWPTSIMYGYHDNSLVLITDVMAQKATAAGIFARYIMKAFYPYEMVYDYSYPMIDPITWNDPLAILGILFLLGSLVAAFWLIRKQPLFSFALALLILPLLLTGNLFFLIGTTMADRLLFVPVIGAMILLVLGLNALLNKLKSSDQAKQPTVLICAGLGLVFAVITIRRNPEWKDNPSLFVADSEIAHPSAKILFNAGTAHLNLAKNDTTSVHYAKAMNFYKRTLKLDSGYVEAYINLGVMYKFQKKNQAAGKLYALGLKRDANNALLLGNYAEVLFDLGDYDDAYRYVIKAEKRGNQAAGIYVIKGTIEFNRKDYVHAVSTFERGLKLFPNQSNLLLNLGNALAMCKRYDAAIAQFQTLRNLEPLNADVHYFLGRCYEKTGKINEANNYYAAANKLRAGKK